MSIVNPFAGYPIDWDWDDHLAHGYAGGTDYKIPAGTPLTAAASGTVRRITGGDTGHPALALDVSPTLLIRYLELGTVVKTGPVKRGDVIATASSKYLHVDVYDHDDRRPFESYVSGFAGEAPTPIIPKEIDMADLLIIDGGNTTGRKAIALAGPKLFHIFTAEEWNLYKVQHNIPALLNIPTVQPVNDAAWDMLRSIHTA